MITKEDIRRAIASHKRKVLSTSQFPDFRKAAVLLLLFPGEEGLSILLTLRTHTVETHKGQISAPGGMTDPEDADATATALRETWEELGIAPKGIEVLGLLDDHVVPSKFIITPIVGHIDHKPEWKENLAEVAAVFDVPLSLFVDRTGVRNEERTLGSMTATLWYFPFKEHTIWGATAGMIVNLVDIALAHKQKAT